MTNARPRAWRVYLIKLMLFAKKEEEGRGKGEEEKAHSRKGRKKGRGRKGNEQYADGARSLLAGHVLFSSCLLFPLFLKYSWTGRE